MPQDEQLQDAIRTAFILDGRFSAQRIDVLVKGGTVHLRGAVRSFRRALAAYDVAASVSGVQVVTNNLEVDFSEQLADDEIANHVRTALGAAAEVVKEAITVSVAHGVATLNGSARDAWQRAVAEDVAGSARGVREVRNLLIADLAEQLQDDESSHDLQTAIVRELGPSGAGIKVGIGNGVAVLYGSVPAQPQKDAAAKIVHRQGFSKVRNEINVSSELR